MKFWDGQIKPDHKRKEFFRIVIVNTKADFRKMWKDLDWDGDSDDVAACFMRNDRARYGSKVKELGLMMFCRSNMRNRALQSEYVAHECTHATLHYLRYLGRLPGLQKYTSEHMRKKYWDTPKKIPEEFACYTLGELVYRVTRKLEQIRRDKGRK